MRKRVLRLATLLVCCIVAGYLLLTLSYLITPERVKKRLSESKKQISAEIVRPFEPISGRQLDNFTDALMLLEVSYDGGESAFVKAANTNYCTLRGLDPFESIAQIDRRPKNFIQVNNYSRYWHGYQVFLRPLLLFFSYSQIRALNGVVLTALITLIAVLMCEKATGCAVPFLLSLLLLGPTAVAQSFQFSGVTYVTLLMLLAILLDPKAMLKPGRAERAFLLAGIAVAFLDLLTFPTLSLTMPLVLLCAFEERERRLSTVIKCVVCWGAGYAGMWVGKWVIAFLFNGKASLDLLFSQIRLRSGTTDWDSSSITRFGAITKNFATMFNNNQYIGVGVACCAAIDLVRLARGFKKLDSGWVKDFAVRCVPAILALGWILALANHSFIHAFFAYRTLVPCVFCLLCALNPGRLTSE